MSGVCLLLSIQQGIHKGKAQCLGLGTIYQTAHKTYVLAGQFRVDLFPDRQSPFAHSHEAALLRPGDQPPQLLLQGSKFLLRHGRRQEAPFLLLNEASCRKAPLPYPMTHKRKRKPLSRGVPVSGRAVADVPRCVCALRLLAWPTPAP